MAAAAAIAKTPVRNNSAETVVVIVLTRAREDIEAARPLLVRILKPGKWFSFERRDELQGEEGWHGYICLDSHAFNLNAWVTFDTAAVWAARSAEIRGADEAGPLQLVPHPTDRLHKTLNEKANMKNPFKMVTSIISQLIQQDVTLVILDRGREEGEACRLLFVRNVTAGSTSEVNVKSVFGDELERVDEVYAYLMFPDQLFKQQGYVWVNFPARMLTHGDFIIFPSSTRPPPNTIAYRSERRTRVGKSRALTWARASFSG